MAVAGCSCDAVSAGIVDTYTTQTKCIFSLWLDVQIHSFYTPWDGVGNSREHVAAPGFTGFGQGGSWALLPQLCRGGMPAGRRVVWVQVNPVRTWCAPTDPVPRAIADRSTVTAAGPCACRAGPIPCHVLHLPRLPGWILHVNLF